MWGLAEGDWAYFFCSNQFLEVGRLKKGSQSPPFLAQRGNNGIINSPLISEKKKTTKCRLDVVPETKQKRQERQVLFGRPKKKSVGGQHSKTLRISLEGKDDVVWCLTFNSSRIQEIKSVKSLAQDHHSQASPSTSSKQADIYLKGFCSSVL